MNHCKARRGTGLGILLFLAGGLAAETVLSDARAPVIESPAPVSPLPTDNPVSSGGPTDRSLPALDTIPPVVTEKPSEPLLDQVRKQLLVGDPRKARRSAKRYLKKNETSAEGWTLLARTYAATGDESRALRRYRKALKFDPHYAPAYHGRGEIHEMRGKLDEAANEYRAAALADPQAQEARDALARLSGNAIAVE